jgi:succinoglycan biosynthesis transport protein ExoP
MCPISYILKGVVPVEGQESIDLGVIIEIIKKNRRNLMKIIVGSTLLAMAVAFILPKQYESTTLVRAKSSQQGSGISLQAASALAMLSGGSMSTPTQAYIEMMKSRSVLDPIIAQLDLPDEEKEKLDAESFAKSNLKIQTTKGTDLIEVAASGRTPEEAQQISTDVINNFQKLLTKLNQSDQSLMIQFLNNRIAGAKKDMEEAEQNLERFRQQEKIYVPDEQAKAIIQKLTEFDKKNAEIRVENDTNQAKLQGVNVQLNKQNVAISRYNIADNPGIQEIRSTIIQKQIALIEMQQRYTDKHPNVVLLQKELTELNDKLSQEVDHSIQSGANTLNPVHAGLLKEKVETETELLVGQAAFDTVTRLQAENEKEISKLSAGSVTYVGLERQVRITQEIYGVLVKNYEQARIQAAMESMDIQIVDEADLPKRPSAPKKMLITAIGGILGVMISFAYVVVLYNRRLKIDESKNIHF